MHDESGWIGEGVRKGGRGGGRGEEGRRGGGRGREKSSE